MTNPTLEKKSSKDKTKLIAFILISLALLGLILASIFTFSVLSYNKVYNGVSINNVSVSQMANIDVYNFLKEKYTDKIKDTKIVLNFENTSKEFLLSDLNVVYDIKKASDKAFEFGRSGNIFSRLISVFNSKQNGLSIDLEYSYDEKILNNLIDEFYSKSLIPVKEAEVRVKDTRVSIVSGHPGKNPDKKRISEILSNSIKSCSGGEFDIPSQTIMPHKINVDEMYNQINTEPVDAQAIVDNGAVTVVPHVLGRKIDKSGLEKIISELDNTNDTEKVLPVEFTQPKINTQTANSMIFKNVLATSSTTFSTNTTNNANRGENIRLAAKILNGKLLAPGETFSFNKVVGPRTKDRGYKEANAYIGGKIVPDVGGGICQVSTTLYNAVLYSDLETVQRKNHMFTVGYVDYGQDAAVFYDDVDFKFKNNTKWPIKIQCSVSSNRLTFSLVGTQETPNKTVQIKNVRISTTAPTVKYINDPTLEEGKTKVVKSGISGCVVDTYKIVKVGDNIISNKKIHRSTYTSYSTEIKRGTKKVSTVYPSPAVSTIIPKTNTSAPNSNTSTPGTNTNTNTPPAEPVEQNQDIIEGVWHLFIYLWYSIQIKNKFISSQKVCSSKLFEKIFSLN